MAAAIASGNPAAIAASKHSLHMLSMGSLNDIGAPLPNQDALEYQVILLIKNIHRKKKLNDQVEKSKQERKGLEFSIKDLEKERDELLRDIKALKGRLDSHVHS